MEKNNTFRVRFLKGENVLAMAFTTQREYLQNMNAYDRLARPYDIQHLDRYILHPVPQSYYCRVRRTLQSIHHTEFIPQFQRDGWYLAVCKDEYENALPHTLGKIIILPEKLFRVSEERFRHTLLHERIHVLQKTYPALFTRLYTDHWGFVPVTPTLPPSLLQRVRSNPDTLSWWSLRGYVPLVLYHADAVNIHDTKEMFWKQGTYNPLVLYRQEDVDWYQEAIGGKQGCYQPEETSAVLLSDFWEEWIVRHKITIGSSFEEALKQWLLTL